MDIGVNFSKQSTIVFSFEDDVMEAIDRFDEYISDRIHGTIYDGCNEIGFLSMFLFYGDSNFREACDSYNSDLTHVAEAVCTKSGMLKKKYRQSDYSKVAILENIYIDKEHRGKGVGSMVLKHLHNMLTYDFHEDNIETILLHASAYEAASKHGFNADEYRKQTNKLISLYEKAGFKYVQNGVMVHTLVQ